MTGDLILEDGMSAENVQIMHQELMRVEMMLTEIGNNLDCFPSAKVQIMQNHNTIESIDIIGAVTKFMRNWLNIPSEVAT